MDPRERANLRPHRLLPFFFSRRILQHSRGFVQMDPPERANLRPHRLLPFFSPRPTVVFSLWPPIDLLGQSRPPVPQWIFVLPNFLPLFSRLTTSYSRLSFRLITVFFSLPTLPHWQRTQVPRLSSHPTVLFSIPRASICASPIIFFFSRQPLAALVMVCP